jgi:hypothetical protein
MSGTVWDLTHKPAQTLYLSANCRLRALWDAFTNAFGTSAIRIDRITQHYEDGRIKSI